MGRGDLSYYCIGDVMKPNHLTRIIQISTFSGEPIISFRRWTADKGILTNYSIHANRLKEKGLQRLDNLTLFADKTSVMTFPRYIVSTSSYWKELD